MERLKIKVAVYMILQNKEGKVLFGRRSNTDWQDGKLSLPSGHIDLGELPTESAIRELKEEVNIEVENNQLEFKHVVYRKDNYIDFYFVVKDWVGEPKVMETNKCSELVWVDVNNNSEEFVPYVLLSTQRAISGTDFITEY